MTRALPALTVTPAVRRRAAAAATVGNFIEWYDFVVYGYFATQISQVFFPSAAPATALMATFATFGVALVARPVGALVFGSLGDRLGRRSSLSAVILLASIATFAIGCLPGYERAGIMAPILLVAARIVQGFSTGGEYGGATSFMIEYAPAGRRALFGSLQGMTQGLAMLAGSLLGAAMNAWMNPDTLATWGWRAPFLVALPLGIIGLYLRLRLEDTPAFLAVRAETQVSVAPLRETLTRQARPILKSIGFVTGWTTTTYLLIYLPTYIPTAFAYDAFEGLLGVVVGLILYVVGTPVVALYADRIGRKPVLMIAALGSVLCPVPAFLLLSLGGIVPLLVANLAIGAVLAFYGAAGSTAISELSSLREFAIRRSRSDTASPSPSSAASPHSSRRRCWPGPMSVSRPAFTSPLPD